MHNEVEFLVFVIIAIALGAMFSFATIYPSKGSVVIGTIASVIGFIFLGEIGILLFVALLNTLIEPLSIFYALIEVVVFIVALVGAFFLFGRLFRCMFFAKARKTIKKLQKTKVYDIITSSLQKYPNCVIYVCFDGVAIDTNVLCKKKDYSLLGDKIYLGKKNSYADDPSASIIRDKKYHYTSVRSFSETCQIFSFSENEMKELDDYRIELLAKTIEYMAGVKKYTSSMIFKTYYMEEYVFHDSGSEGSVIKTGDIYTVYPGTSAKGHWEEKTEYTALKFAVAFPRLPKEKKEVITKQKTKKKNWI